MASSTEIRIAKQRYKARLDHYKKGDARILNETADAKEKRISELKKSFKLFVEYYFADYLKDENGKIITTPDFHVDFANKVKKNKSIKIIQRWARAHAKSVVSDIFLPMWLWANDDIFYMVQIGNSEDKAKILIADLQAEFSNPLIVNDYGVQKTRGNWEKGYFVTANGFVCKSFGMGQDVRGLRLKNKRPDYIVADDLEDKDTLRNEKKQDEVAQWLLSSVIPTMDGNRRRFVFAGNKFAPRMIQTVLEELNPNWTIHQIDAYTLPNHLPRWKEKYTATYWKEIEKEIGILAARAEYCNQPHATGKIFKPEQIQWGTRPSLNHFKAIVGHWDIAYAGTETADYNAVRVWGLYAPEKKEIKQFWYIDSFVRQTKMKEAVQWICEYQKSLPETVRIQWQFESQFWNDEVKRIITETEKQYNLKLNLIKIDTPKGKKYDRILELQPYFQNNRIFYDQTKKADTDCIIGLQQLYKIEPGYRSHDDAPDADHQAIVYLETRSVTRQAIRTGNYTKNKNRQIR